MGLWADVVWFDRLLLLCDYLCLMFVMCALFRGLFWILWLNCFLFAWVDLVLDCIGGVLFLGVLCRVYVCVAAYSFGCFIDFVCWLLLLVVCKCLLLFCFIGCLDLWWFILLVFVGCLDLFTYVLLVWVFSFCF